MNLQDVMTEYDRQVRANDGSEWPALLLVATCQDGEMGAWGEVLDLAETSGVALTDQDYDALHDLFLAYQQALRAELGAVIYRHGDRVATTGAGKTAKWGDLTGTVTDFRVGKVYVAWDGSTVTEDEMAPAEVKPVEGKGEVPAGGPVAVFYGPVQHPFFE